MAGITPNEGETVIVTMITKGSSVDRGSSLQLGLFTNSTISETTALGSITEPTGGSYARKTLTDASWTVSGDNATYALQTFTATGSDYVGSIYGYFIATTGTTPRLLQAELNGAGPVTMIQNDTYDVTPKITVA